MDFKEVKKLTELPDNELILKFVELFHEMTHLHDAGQGYDHIDWRNLSMSPNGELKLDDVTFLPVSDELRLRNYHDYAAIIYCVCTRQRSAESMSWDAGRKIKQPVLREIVLTICGRNDSIEPLLKKLQEPYINDDTFFKGYRTVDEKEAYEAYKKAEQIRIQKEQDEARAKYAATYVPMVTTPRKSWFERIGVFILMALCFGGYRACTASKKMQHDTNVKMMRQMPHVPHHVPTVPLRHNNNHMQISCMKSSPERMFL